MAHNIQKEEKQLELTVDALIQKVSELKNSIGSLIYKMEHDYETLNWPSVLDSFCSISGELTLLGRVMKGDKISPLRNQLVLPLMLSQEPDENLEKMTEGRVVVFNHDVVPNYLRTKAEPEVEEKTQQLITKTQLISQDTTQKQLNSLNKTTSNLLDIINPTKDNLDSDGSQKGGHLQTFSSADTDSLISTLLNGKNLRQTRGRISESPQTAVNPGQAKMQTPVMTKMPSAKVTIKSGGSHPYQRP